MRGLALFDHLIHVASIRFGRFGGFFLGLAKKLRVGFLRGGGRGRFVGEEVGKRDFFVVAEKPVAKRLRERENKGVRRGPAGGDAPPPR